MSNAKHRKTVAMRSAVATLKDQHRFMRAQNDTLVALASLVRKLDDDCTIVRLTGGFVEIEQTGSICFTDEEWAGWLSISDRPA